MRLTNIPSEVLRDRLFPYGNRETIESLSRTTSNARTAFREELESTPIEGLLSYYADFHNEPMTSGMVAQIIGNRIKEDPEKVYDDMLKSGFRYTDKFFPHRTERTFQYSMRNMKGPLAVELLKRHGAANLIRNRK